MLGTTIHEVKVANSVLRANDHRDVYNQTGAVFLQPLLSYDLSIAAYRPDAFQNREAYPW